mmetsp:Transcript_8178/g.14799  ORF Transcript_8178/g.14799 Transcript_8178/m.14799 type:complete len:663 (+) Transcript_8178:643-2631(+)|eukprot:CAMPEP_0201612084 /NCGR_PEP_ID=MMETSP0492-20130828/22022_1 /ASSEMBLY_ACC=CAM_ASM_000837 /TAXON_ID=420259 /ORGANISM="Thalassiosira gravida, Strain GMp14c1" /LENGTH=662 /DNA_ID=CAMNT_0048078475 /DNA_START=454 /DNA_END=2442 /DNA_ORIENTATION=-
MRKERQRLQSRTVSDQYAEKLGSKLGGRKGRQVGRMLGIDVSVTSSQTTVTAEEEKKKQKPKLGVLDDDDLEDYFNEEDEDDVYEVMTEEERRERAEIISEAASDAIDMLRRNVDDDGREGKKESEDEDMDEEDMLNAVNKALERAGGFPSMSGRELLDEEDNIATVPMTLPVPDVLNKPSVVSSTASTGEKTSSVGGAWTPPTEQKKEEAYQPKVGTWGAFPRPRNISVAYGGGKRIGADVKTDATLQQQSIDDTKERLRAYREKMGIEVQSEKDHVNIIEEALELSGRAMMRGSYSAGVSALEKVTQYCSTRSKLGGKVFLELAMAYEAEGKTDQAIGLYAALSKSSIEQIKMNADKLLYGLEAMNFMRNEAKLKEFSRKKVADTFIDATGFNDITKNFDNVYNTAYIDLDKGGQYYRMLTENVVRSTREARQILLRAVSKGEVDRMKVVQALRSISRHFDDALVAEKKNEEDKNVPVDYAGRPIVSARRSTQDDLAAAIGMGGFVLLSPPQTLENLDGEWRLQLMADKKGDAVEFFNSTLFWQAVDSSGMTYGSGSKGLRSSSQSGDLGFDESDRILSRDGASTSQEVKGRGGGLFSMLLGGGGGIADEMTKVPQQIMTVDSALLVTRAVVKSQAADNVKGYFSVWRRAEAGSFAKSDR